MAKLAKLKEEKTNYYTPDYKKIADAYNEKYGSNVDGNYLSQVLKGNLPSVGVFERAKDVVYFGSKLKKEFETINYKLLARDVSKMTGRTYSSSYVKRTHEGVYKSQVVLDAIEKLL